MTLDMMGYVRPVIQTLTITLPIHYCISSTTYAITIYIVKISRENYGIMRNNCKLSEIYLYYSSYPYCCYVGYGV